MNRRIDRPAPAGKVRLPETAIVVVTGTDPDGDAVARLRRMGPHERSGTNDLHGRGTIRQSGTGPPANACLCA
jgi:hypothetical protein